MKKIKLTEMVKASGWAAKISPEILSQVLRGIEKSSDPNLLVGTEHSDDAAVYKINEETAIIQSLDFFTPIVDDAYEFGQIAAANALSDIYAMGGEPLLALNIVCFPDCLDPEYLHQILKGGQDKLKEAGAMLVGGHSISDNEPKYGLSVTGIVHPDRLKANSMAKSGDKLILTKKLGTGIINTAIKADLAEEETIKNTIIIMKTLNKYAKEVSDNFESVHAITDITGFGLAGHAIEMAEGSNLTVHIESKKLPIIKEAEEFAKMGIIPAGTYKNKDFFKEKTFIKSDVEMHIEDICFDPQTSGGLLISVSEKDADKLLEEMIKHDIEASIVGELKEKSDKFLVIE